jgi:hypothetical protein
MLESRRDTDDVLAIRAACRTRPYVVKDRGVAKSVELVATWERVSRARKQTPVELACL